MIFTSKHGIFELPHKLPNDLTLRIEYVEFSGGGHFFCFRLEIPFLDKFSPKY